MGAYYWVLMLFMQMRTIIANDSDVILVQTDTLDLLDDAENDTDWRVLATNVSMPILQIMDLDTFRWNRTDVVTWNKTDLDAFYDLSNYIKDDDLFFAKDQPAPFENGTAVRKNGRGNVIIVVRPHNVYPLIKNQSGDLEIFDFSGLKVDDDIVSYDKLCDHGSPLMMSARPLYCSLKIECPKNYWCHIGSSKSTTYCCPKDVSTNLCELPVALGKGTGAMTRWHFDPNLSACRTFKYSGYGGNENNFLIEGDCVRNCMRSQKTVRKHMPDLSKAVGPPCVEPAPVRGHGMNHSTRWYFDQDDKKCRQFTYYGEGGTANNFKNLEDCESVCIFRSKPDTFEPEADSGLQESLKPRSQQPTNPCVLPMTPGSGTATTTRWYYDAAAHECRSFVFFGLGGNQNNFATKEECQNACGAPLFIDPSVCVFSQDAGNGPYSIPRWAFNPIVQRCDQFYYKGYGGNYNRFPTKDLCERTCLRPITSAPSLPGYLVYPSGMNPFPTYPTRSINPGGGMAGPFSTFINGNQQPAPHQPYPNQPFPNQPVPYQPFIGYERSIPGNGQSFPAPGNQPASVFLPAPPGVRAGSNGLPKNPAVVAEKLNPANPAHPENQIGNPGNSVQPRNHIGNPGNSVQPRSQIFEPNIEKGFVAEIPNGFTPTGTTNGEHPIWNPEIRVSEKEGTTPLPVYPPVDPESVNSGQGAKAKYPFPNSQIPFQPNQVFPPNQIFQPGPMIQPNQQVFPPIPTYNPFTPAPAAAGSANPCRQGAPAVLRYCGPNNNYQCGPGHYCHVGGSVATTICCPSISETPCNQPLEMGMGSDQLNRFYYNSATGRCQNFVYRGLLGNQNSFLTYDQCQVTCSANPCGTGTAYVVNGQTVHCSALQRGICPQNYFCHIGFDTSTTVCCPRAGEDVCNLATVAGSGQGQLQRWAYDPQARTCEGFIYSGMGGNENNFVTEADCRGTCPVFVNPCASGQPATAPGTSNTLYCSTSQLNTCPSGYFCHLGSGSESTLCCPVSGTNPCQVPLATGTGNAVMSRYYFDFVASMCKAFTYTGMKGNENNFASLLDCRKACPEYQNPCPTGTPLITPETGQVQFCSQTNPNCPVNFWCHIGANRQTSVCCPNPANPCSQPKILGSGKSQLPRWFFDSTARTCHEFIYTGTGGNQNSFLTKAECEAACPVLDNPCSNGMPAIGPQGNPVLCSTANMDVCPPTYWCHIGATAAATLCCPNAGDPCRMPMARGAGTSVLNRWYYNTDTQTCLSFTYTGKGGNQNDFLSLAECRSRCPEFQNPCSTGQPHIGLNGQITHCGATTPSICPTTYWCHVGGTLDSSVCCPGAGNPCELPLAAGNGNDNLLRFYYESATQRCKQFQYSGMGGNENHFMTQRACEERCPVFRNPCTSGEPARNPTGQIVPCSVSNLSGCPSGFWCHVGAEEQSTVCCPLSTGLASVGSADPAGICRQPLQIGTGSSALPRHYFNAMTQQCLPFTYSGIGGNENNYLSRADCERACPVFNSPCSGGDPATGPNGQYILCTATSPNVCPANYWCHIGDLNTNAICCPGSENPCVLPVNSGVGTATLTRFHFDMNIRRCTRFTYGGSGGNQNNFLSLQDCQLQCPELQNPCSTGDPAQAPGGGILFCSRQAQTCPSGYWCHIGFDSESTVCCPGSSAPCMQSLAPGSGSGRESRWYFNQNTRQCLPFTYTGLGGNQNNFLGETECAQTCPTFRNPCGSTMAPPQLLYCSAQNPNACPAGYWCHVGLVTETTVCCPGSADPCTLPLATGTATTALVSTRWYYDSSQRSCKTFQYSGMGGNQNNFLTQEECQQKCPEFSNPCVSGEPYRDSGTGLTKFCNQNLPNDCPTQFWCHVGATQQTTVCCPGAGDRCTLPLSVGYGPASLPRWHFNPTTRQCQQYTYRGMGGNQNNFLGQRDCQIECPEFDNPCGDGSPLTSISGQVQYCSVQNPNICPPNYFCHIGLGQDTTVCCPGAGNPCNLPREIGRGSASLQRYFFNQLTRRCETFMYSGAGGNANNYATLSDCRSKCDEFQNPCSSGLPYRSPGGQVLYCNEASTCPPNYFCHYGEDTVNTMCCPTSGDPCSLPVFIGSGSAQLTRHYYNSVVRNCVSFVYSGIGGNENNFRTLAECQARCQPLANPCGGGSSPYRDSNGRNVQCGSSSGLISNVCPTTHFCHVGADVWNTVCCPMLGNQCEMNLVEGNGQSNLQRWYFNPSTRSCQLFSYRGTSGNANNFLTQDECLRACATLSSPTGPCPHGDPLMDASGIARTCRISHPQPEPDCPSTYVCNLEESIGVDPAAQSGTCCPDPRYFCVQPRDGGSRNCPGPSGNRFGYNPSTDTCIPFSFSGCGGNMNNFYSIDTCTRVCCNKGFNKRFLDRRTMQDDADANVTYTGGDLDIEDYVDQLLNITDVASNHTQPPHQSRVRRWIDSLWNKLF